MASLRLSPAALAPGARITCRWAFSPRVDWPARRARFELALRVPGAPRGSRIRPLELGGVPGEEVRLGDADPGELTLLYLHGGGYCIGSPRGYRAVTGRLARGFGGPVVALDYRLAPEHPFPAALEDARAAWQALAAERSPERIVIAGDSAGAGLTLALAQELRDGGEPLPAGIGLIAPWLDAVPDAGGERAGDPREVALSRGLMGAFTAAYLGSGGAPDDTRVSPLRGELGGLPPIALCSSDHDLLRDDAERLRQLLPAGALAYDETLPELWHDPFVFAWALAEPTASAPERFGAALREHAVTA